MNQKLNKKVLLQIVLGLLVLLVVSLSVVVGVQATKNNKLEDQINVIKKHNSNWVLNSEEEVDELRDALNDDLRYVVVTFIDIDESETYYVVDKNKKLTVYDLLILTTHSVDDFASYDDVNYYFKDAMTDVVELKDNENYYEDSEWGAFLIVGLQGILVDQNLTVIKSGF